MHKKLVDLSHPLDHMMSLFPGTRGPTIRCTHTIETDQVRVMEMAFNSHSGTHLDAPAHMIPNGKYLSQFPLEYYYGPGQVIDCSDCRGNIFLENLKSFEDSIKQRDFIFLYTGFDQFWGSDKYLENYPVLSAKAAGWLASFNIKGIGMDTISIDAIDSKEHPIHKILFENEILALENLNNLKLLINHHFYFLCLPLPVPDMDGSPTRAVAFLG